MECFTWENSRAQVLTACSIERLDCLFVDFWYFFNVFCNEVVAICYQNVLYLREKSPCSFHGACKKQLTNGFVKICENYAALWFFFWILSMCSEPNYEISHPHIILEALSYFESTLFSFFTIYFTDTLKIWQEYCIQLCFIQHEACK